MSEADEGTPLATRTRPRVMTVESAARFEAELLSDPAHSITSAAHAVGLNPNTVRDAINRYQRGEFESEQHAEVCRLFALAKSKHVKDMRNRGLDAANKANGPGVSWFKWQLEVQDPTEHPRKAEVELTGKDGGPVQVNATLGAMSDAQLEAFLARKDGET